MNRLLAALAIAAFATTAPAARALDPVPKIHGAVTILCTDLWCPDCVTVDVGGQHPTYC